MLIESRTHQMNSANAFSTKNASSASQITPVVFVVDDDIRIRQSLEMRIPGAGWAVETFATAKEFLARKRPNSPSCLILDLNLPDITGLDVQRCVAEDGGTMPVIFVTTCADVPSAVQAMKAGAIEFLTKPCCEDILLTTIQQALASSRAAIADRAHTRRLRRRFVLLTKREREIMGLVVEGLMNKQVARELGISEFTVKAHRGKMMRKMGAASIAELVNMAARLTLQQQNIEQCASMGDSREDMNPC
jgi:FixJ family two-component response regulator